jgi:hypothetical protein
MYLLITYKRQQGGQINEEVQVARRIRDNDIRTVNVIMDYAEKKVIRCFIDGKVVDSSFDLLHEYYKKFYPAYIEQLEKLSQPSPD